MKSKIWVYLATALSMVFWGVSFIWSKEILNYKPITLGPIALVFVRLIISSGLLWIFGLMFKKLQKVSKTEFKQLLLLSFFQPFLYFIGETVGLTYLSSTITSVLVATIPLFTLLAARIFFKEKINLINSAGIFVSIIGVILVVLNDSFSLVASPIGILLLSLAVFSAVAYSIVIIKITDKLSPFSIITYQNTISIVYFLPFFLYFDFNHTMQVHFTYELLFPLMMLSVFASSIAFMLYTYGIQKLGITKANAFSNTIPVFTAIFAFFLIPEEKLFAINFLGIILVMTGLFMTQVRQHHFVRLYMFITKYFK